MSPAKWIIGACWLASSPLLLEAQVTTTPPTAPTTPTSQPRRQQPPVLTRLRLNGNAATVAADGTPLLLEHGIAGAAPTEYRVSARADMADARWASYAVPLQLRGWHALVSRAPCDGAQAGERLLLFLQVRAEMGGAMRIVNGQRVLMPQRIESNIVSDAICVVTGS